MEVYLLEQKTTADESEVSAEEESKQKVQLDELKEAKEILQHKLYHWRHEDNTLRAALQAKLLKLGETVKANEAEVEQLTKQRQETASRFQALRRRAAHMKLRIADVDASIDSIKTV
eukprot:gene12746-15995_t